MNRQRHIALMAKNLETAEDYLNTIYGGDAKYHYLSASNTFNFKDVVYQIITPATSVLSLRGRCFDAIVSLNQFKGQDGVSEHLAVAIRGWDTKASEIERLQQQVTEIQRKIIELAGGKA